MSWTRFLAASRLNSILSTHNELLNGAYLDKAEEESSPAPKLLIRKLGPEGARNIEEKLL